MSQKLVSIIIPCFNSEHWLKEAIDSCFKQSYPKIEVIVVDDGSTDGSLNIIESYGNNLIWESGPNRGGNYARNKGFSLSTGEYIQYLDADDYILPEKIERQIDFLEETNADVIYGDWQHQYHLSDGHFYLDAPKISGDQSDILESLLAGWWVSPACLLFRRTVVEKSGGWDETLKAGQDKDFFLSVVLNGAKIVYQPGCYSIYRRYGDTTVSTSSKIRYLENHQLILEKFERKLSEQDRFSDKYCNAIAQSYFAIARAYLSMDPSLYSFFLNKTLSLSPNFEPKFSDRTSTYNFAQRIFGFRRIERVVILIKRFSLLSKRMFD